MRPLLVLVSTAAVLAACDPRAAPSSDAPSAASPGGPQTQSPAPGAEPYGPVMPPEDDAKGPTPPTSTPTNDPMPPAGGEQGGTDDWRAVASAGDEDRLARIDQAWRQALDEAREKGFSAEIRALGALADPNAGQAGATPPPPGTYRCRAIKLGSTDGAGLGYVAYPGFRCTIELTPGGDLILTKTTGSQRTRGLLYPNGGAGVVFIGAQAWGAGESGYPDYGEQPERDQIGLVERIGENRWRLALPWPKQESKLDLIELRR